MNVKFLLVERFVLLVYAGIKLFDCGVVFCVEIFKDTAPKNKILHGGQFVKVFDVIVV